MSNPVNLFESLSVFSSTRRRIILYNPDDILRTEVEWHPEDLMLPVEERGGPRSIRKEVRPGAVGREIEVVPLSAIHTAHAEAITDAAVPPRRVVDLPPDKPGGKPAKDVVYDDEDPAYLADLRKAQDRRDAFITLRGVVGLWESTPGETEDAKIDALRAGMPAVIIRYLSGLIYHLSFAAGDLADFFTKEGSDATKSSGPSPRQNQKAARKK